jgi:hypothetical protein
VKCLLCNVLCINVCPFVSFGHCFVCSEYPFGIFGFLIPCWYFIVHSKLSRFTNIPIDPNIPGLPIMYNWYTRLPANHTHTHTHTHTQKIGLIFVRSLYCACCLITSSAILQNYCFSEEMRNQKTKTWVLSDSLSLLNDDKEYCRWQLVKSHVKYNVWTESLNIHRPVFIKIYIYILEWQLQVSYSHCYLLIKCWHI